MYKRGENMKKRLLLLPIIGAFMLTGCRLTIGNKTIVFLEKKSKENNQENNNQQNNNNNEQNEQNTEDEVDAPVLKEEFGDYKLAKSVQDGKKYLFGVYRHEYEIMRFFNGDYHRDGDAYYPYYMNTTENTVEGAAEVELHMIDAASGTFSLQVHASGKVWDNKYIGIYPAKTSGKKPVMSIALLADPQQTSYFIPDENGDPTTTAAEAPCGIFKFHDEVMKAKTYAPAISFQHSEAGDTEAVPKFFGTAGSYTSIDCKSYEEAILGSVYDLAHLYEHK